jgi:hypothetical protein
MREIEEKRKAAGERSYDHLFKEKDMKSNKELVDEDAINLEYDEDGHCVNDRERVDAYEEDFM